MGELIDRNKIDVSLQNVGPTMWPWAMTLTLDFQVKFRKSCIPGMGGPINMEQKGCESIGS